jgi:hypothetical protein
MKRIGIALLAELARLRCSFQLSTVVNGTSSYLTVAFRRLEYVLVSPRAARGPTLNMRPWDNGDLRDIEDAFRDESGRLLLSKAAVSQLRDRLWEDYKAFAQRDLGEYAIIYFVRWRHCPALAAWRQALGVLCNINYQLLGTA